MFNPDNKVYLKGDKKMKIKSIGSNLSELVKNDGTIVIFSYSTPVIAWVDCNLYVTNQFYSKTTSRQINKYLEGLTGWVKKDPSFFENLVK